MAMYKKYKYLRAETKAKAFACPKCISTIEVIVYRVMMYANPLLIVQAMYFPSKGQSVYYCTRG